MAKKQVPLRISEDLYDDLARWADKDFRSINGQIEYLLTTCVRYHKRSGQDVPTDISTGEEEE